MAKSRETGTASPPVLAAVFRHAGTEIIRRLSSLTIHEPNPRNSSHQQRTPDQLGGWSPECPAARVGMTSREFPMRALSVLSLSVLTLPGRAACEADFAVAASGLALSHDGPSARTWS